MFKLLTVMLALGVSTAFSQLVLPSGFKRLDNGLSEMTFKDVRKAIEMYNFVLDSNNGDTSSPYDIMSNPIDFSHLKKENGTVLVSILMRDMGRYKVLFGEIPSDEEKFFFRILGEDGVISSLIYKP